MIWAYYRLTFVNLFTLIVSDSFPDSKFFFSQNLLILASDNKTSIYTVATCGTDHLIKIWRIFCLVDAVHSGSKTRLVPSTPQVCINSL